MKNKIKRLTAAFLIAACALTSAAPAYAQSTVTVTERAGAVRKGWEFSDGNWYYFNKKGELVTENRIIDGVCYRFRKDGVCAGKLTGWYKRGEKRFYYENGEPVYGWVHVYKSWYYIDKKWGRLTGKYTIDGYLYDFGKLGVWNKKMQRHPEWNSGTDAEVTADEVMKKIKFEMNHNYYGGAYESDGAVFIWSVDGKAENCMQKIGWFRDMQPLFFMEAKFSLTQLERAAAALEMYAENNPNKFFVRIDETRNAVIAVYNENEPFLETVMAELIDELPERDCVILEPMEFADVD